MIRTKCMKLHAKSRLVEKIFITGKIFLRRRILWKFCIYIYISCKYSWKCYLSSTVLFIMAAFSSLTYQLEKWFFFSQVLPQRQENMYLQTFKTVTLNIITFKNISKEITEDFPGKINSMTTLMKMRNNSKTVFITLHIACNSSTYKSIYYIWKKYQYKICVFKGSNVKH